MRATRSHNVILDHCFVQAEMVFDELRIPSAGDFLVANESAINLRIPRCRWGLDVPSCARLKRTCDNADPGLRAAARLSRRHPPPGGEDERGIRSGAVAAPVRSLGSGYRRPDASGAGRVLQGEIDCGEAVAAATRSALEMGGAHALIKGAPIERLFRDGATATMMQPSSDVCLAELSIYELAA